MFTLRNKTPVSVSLYSDKNHGTAFSSQDGLERPEPQARVLSAIQRRGIALGMKKRKPEIFTFLGKYKFGSLNFDLCSFCVGNHTVIIARAEAACAQFEIFKNACSQKLNSHNDKGSEAHSTTNNG